MNKKIIVIFSACILLLAVIVIVLRTGGATPAYSPQAPGAGKNALKPKGIPQLLDLAKKQEANNELLSAKESYQEIMDNYPDYAEMPQVEKKIDELNAKIIFSPTLITDSSRYYEIKPGDSLIKIAQQFNTTPELIKKINMLKSEVIRPKMQIKIWTGKFSVLVDKSQNTLMLKSGGELIKTYLISTGKNNSSPVGTFKIVNKLIDPSWFKPGLSAAVPAGSPENILGSRWMGFDLPSYGIHGTTEPQNLGKQITEGCVRMKNEDVEELYIFLPQGAEVTIVD